MKIFKIWQEVNNGYDTYDSAIVVAENEEEARKSPIDIYYEWAHPDDIKVEYIGEAKEGTEKGVILASFNAG